MPNTDNVNLGFEIEVVEGDALDFPADVLALKDAPRSGGLDAQVRRKLRDVGELTASGSFLEIGEYRLCSGEGVARAEQVLMVGTPSIFDLHYPQIRDLGRRFLTALHEAGSTARHVVMTAHGVRTALALDDVEALRSLLLGLADAHQTGDYPPTLERITIIEKDARRAALFQNALRQFLLPPPEPAAKPASEPAPEPVPPPPPAPQPPEEQQKESREHQGERHISDEVVLGDAEAEEAEIDIESEEASVTSSTYGEIASPADDSEPVPGVIPYESWLPLAPPSAPAPSTTPVTATPEPARMAGPESFSPEFRKPTADESTPHVFVAMPFRDDYDDQFYLAILPSVRELGLLCERMDLDTFTGDITDHMFNRIETARIVIALLDSANPNVYLEIGYAWGVRTPTVLLAHKEEPLPFDVRGHRVLIYDKIYQLKEMLQAELARLLR